MHMRLTPEDTEILKATIGFEGELTAIKFLLIKNRNIQTVKGNDVLTVLDETSHGVQIVQDNAGSPKFFGEIKKIANEEKYTVLNCTTAHIFEFVTQPISDANDLSPQFNEISTIEKHLLAYLFKQAKQQRESQFVSVKDWLQDLKCKCPNILITPAETANDMYIVLDFSIQQLELTNPQKKLLNQSTKDDELYQLANEVHQRLAHSVQFNFVVSLGKKMGSHLAEIYDSNNNSGLFKTQIDKDLKLLDEWKPSSNMNKDEIKADLMHNSLLLKKINDRKKLLLLAESCAENACDFIRSEYANSEYLSQLESLSLRKLAKLEGFFFIISMRVLTEITYFHSTLTNTPKNKYLFFLKTNLSNLMDCLSEDDHSLLKHIEQHWTPDKKNQLLALIAGSFEALTIFLDRDKSNYTLKDIIKSALKWEDGLPAKLCDKLPNFPTKEFASPFEPAEGLHSKKQPFQRVLLEYRSSQRKTISESEVEMKKTLQQSLVFCKTTHLHTNDWKKNWNLQKVQEYLATNSSQAEVYDLMEALRLYNSQLYDDVLEKIPDILDFIKPYEKSLIQLKRNYHDESDMIEINSNAAINIILYSDLASLSIQLREILFSEDVFLTLTQINYVFIKLKKMEVISEEKKLNATFILKQLASEKVYQLFKFPLNAFNYNCIYYLLWRFNFLSTIPEIKNYFQFLTEFSATHSHELSVNVLQHNHQWIVEYSFKPGANITKPSNKGHTPLDFACKLGSSSFAHHLLNHGAKAKLVNVLSALRNNILDHDMANKMVCAGVNFNACFYSMAKNNLLVEMIKLTKIIGIAELDNAIKEHSKVPDVIENLIKTQILLAREKFNLFQPELSENSVVTINKDHTKKKARYK